ncbi:hypothetical protein Xkoz_03645 [Xenorhabdus kozodoii]|uniref:Uncharacterized protein n=1 Tax=Xenorhabdus kozodoii TaxID=351676 RepID=A0A2D0KZD8_9GAMM|nr:hypothetical protein Xkoz_03645 [Xenorhabdus kozodoii]
MASDNRGDIRGWQRLAVEFAVRGERESFQGHKGTGQHIIRQMLAELLPQCRRHQYHPVLWPQIGDQPFLSGFVCAGDHHRFTHPVTLGQSGLDFSQLDTEAAQFDLKIIPAKVFNCAIRQPAAEVTGFVHPGSRIRAERIGKETLGRQFGTVEVTTGDTSSDDIHFPRHPKRHRMPVGIENIDPQVSQRLANQTALP